MDVDALIYPEHARLQFVLVGMWQCGLAFIVPLSVFPTGFYNTVIKLALQVRETIYGPKTEIQRHKIKHHSGLSDERHFWELLSSFQSKGRLVFGLSSCSFSLLNLRTDL